MARAKLLKDHKRHTTLVEKLETLTGKSSKRVRKALRAAAGLKPRKQAVKSLEKFIADNPWKAVKGVKKPRKMTVKEKKDLVRIDVALASDPNRFDAVKDAPKAAGTYATDYQFHKKWLKGLAVTDNLPSNTWKAVLLSEEMQYVRRYYDLYVLDDNYKEKLVGSWLDVNRAAASENWRFVLRIRKCPGCTQALGRAACPHVLDSSAAIRCQDLGPLTTHLDNLRQSLNAIISYRGCVQESYSILVRPSTTITGPSSGGTWSNGKRVRVFATASRLLMRAPGVKELNKGDPKVIYRAGKLLGFQDGKVAFYGRCPVLVPLSLWLYGSGAEVSLPLVAFHGPFGKSTNDGIVARARSMDELLKVGVGAPEVMIKDAPDGLIIPTRRERSLLASGPSTGSGSAR